MVLSGAVIAGISAASTIVAIVIILALCIAVKKRRRTAEYLERCGRLWEKYGRRSQGSDIVAKFPFADPSYIKTPVPGQQFTSQELNQGGFVLLRKQSGENDAGICIHDCCFFMSYESRNCIISIQKKTYVKVSLPKLKQVVNNLLICRSTEKAKSNFGLNFDS